MEQFAAFVAIDWSDTKHDICLVDVATGKKESLILKHTPEELEAWATALRSRFGGRPIAVCLEQSRGPLIYALLKYDFLVLYPITLPRWPSTVKRSRPAEPRMIRGMRTICSNCSSSIGTGSRPGGQIMPRHGRSNISWSTDVAWSMTAPGSAIG